ncbi:MAG: hypothetical protein IKO99_05145, partial [Bacteroidales bacterium]|nr:hypothetical protein [Bacteroidales bacterium]
ILSQDQTLHCIKFLFDVGFSCSLSLRLVLAVNLFKYRIANSCQNRGAKLLTYFLITKFF